MGNRLSLGRSGELHACNYLVKKGYIILEKNYRCRIGEIDIIAARSNTIHFIEVKTRSTLQYGMPEESIDSRKLAKIKTLAEVFLVEKNISDKEISFDAITLFLKDGRIILNHIKNIL